MTDDELLYASALTIQLKNNVRKAHRLLDQYDSMREAFLHTDAPKEVLKRAEKEVEFVHHHQLSVYGWEEDNYPFLLQQCPDAPLLLYGKGNLRVNEGHFLSVVGTRSATDRGKQLTHDIVIDLAGKVPNLTIVSGLAFGIDVAAHQAALEAGISTIIIPGHGLDRIYPALHRNVAVRSLENGGILTEYPSDTNPDRINFVARDRIIAGISEATLVVESKEKGGSLITAQMALDYNRTVFAIPGRPSDDYSQGCNSLIKYNKARLTTTADDIIAEMGWETAEKKKGSQQELDLHNDDLSTDEQRLLNLIDEDGIQINSIVMETDIAYNDAVSLLMGLELKGYVRSLPGGVVRRLR